MSNNLSIEKLFSPPDGLYGAHLMLCGMTADVATLDNILEAFTGDSADARRSSGFPAGFILLDATSPNIPVTSVPGLFNFSVNAANWTKWKAQTSLLHAKVALLGFSKHKFDSQIDCFRLIVSTGNWTSNAFGVAGSIDMVWKTDADPAEYSQDWRDCYEAFDFFERLLRIYNYKINDLPSSVGKWFAEWKNIFEKRKRFSESPRFFHSLEKDLFSQILSRFPGQGIGTLCAGSGFFEGATVKNEAPVILEALDQLGGSSEKLIVVNQCRAGALASYFQNGANGGWTPRRPLKQSGNRKDLHAKFVAAIGRGLVRAVYLGSGNLSKMGLKSHASEGAEQAGRGTGNIEAGVVFTPVEKPQDWEKTFVCGTAYGRKELSQFVAGEEENVRLEAIEPSPILWIEQENSELIPRWAAECTQAEFFDGEKWSIAHVGEQIALLTVNLLTVKVRRDQHGSVHEVPVLSADGSFRHLPGSKMSLDEILDLLADYPLHSYEEVEEQEDADEELTEIHSRKNGSGRYRVQYPLKTLMNLVESIALKHEELTADQFSHWIKFLREKLCVQMGDEQINELCKLKLNPFSVLLQPGFAPDFLDQIPQGKEQLQSLIFDITDRWKLHDASDLRTLVPVAEREQV